jgi:hypothetical protein
MVHHSYAPMAPMHLWFLMRALGVHALKINRLDGRATALMYLLQGARIVWLPPRDPRGGHARRRLRRRAQRAGLHQRLPHRHQ